MFQVVKAKDGKQLFRKEFLVVTTADSRDNSPV